MKTNPRKGLEMRREEMMSPDRRDKLVPVTAAELSRIDGFLFLLAAGALLLGGCAAHCHGKVKNKGIIPTN